MEGLLVVAGLIAGYWLGWHVHMATGTWVDHRDQAAKAARLRRARWTVWRGAFWPAVAVVIAVAAALAAR